MTHWDKSNVPSLRESGFTFLLGRTILQTYQ
jgi:hypothetical protein